MDKQSEPLLTKIMTLSLFMRLRPPPVLADVLLTTVVLVKITLPPPLVAIAPPVSPAWLLNSTTLSRMQVLPPYTYMAPPWYPAYPSCIVKPVIVTTD